MKKNLFFDFEWNKNRSQHTNEPLWFYLYFGRSGITTLHENWAFVSVGLSVPRYERMFSSYLLMKHFKLGLCSCSVDDYPIPHFELLGNFCGFYLFGRNVKTIIPNLIKAGSYLTKDRLTHIWAETNFRKSNESIKRCLTSKKRLRGWQTNRRLL